MSAYKVIKINFKNLESLKAALCDIGYGERSQTVAKNPLDPDLVMSDYRGHHRPELASLLVARAYINQYSNDVGFAWNEKDKCYDAIISEWDSYHTFTPARLNRLKQAYALHEVHRQAKARGYRVQESRNQDGTISITLKKGIV